jgi:hypothetical protein
MAKQEAIYECVVTCTYNMPMLDGSIHNHFYKSAAECEDPSQNSLAVPAGTVVPKHFIPKTDQAKKDRKAQIERPVDFLETKEHMVLLAELLVHEGFFKARNEAEEAIREQAKDKDVDPEKLGEASADETKRIRAIEELMGRANDDKALRAMLGKILKKGDVTFFPGAKPRSLAEKVYDNDLYVEPKGE